MSLHLGGMGVKVGHFIWDDLCIENGIATDCTYKYDSVLQHQGETIKTYFKEKGDKYYPRTLFFDMDVNSIDFVKQRSESQFDPECFLLGEQTSPGLFSSGFYSNGPAYIDKIKERIEGKW